MMAKAIKSIIANNRTSSSTPTIHSLYMLRLAFGFTILLGSIITTLGFSWDIQWHDFVGRDRTLSPPHLVLLAGIFISGMAALFSVLTESRWNRRNAQLASHSTSFAGLFTSSLGAYIAGYAALNAAIAFPLDSYWHALYGIDVSVWAPFHIMIGGASAIIPLGAAYMLLSAAHIAIRTGMQKVKRWAYIGVLLAMATMLMLFTYLLKDALDFNFFLNIAGVQITFFPLLSGIVVALTLIPVVQAIPWRLAATTVLLVYIVYGLLFMAFVPAATDYLVILEGQVYRPEAEESSLIGLSVVTMDNLFLLPILVAPLIDLCFHRSERKNWSRTKFITVMTLVSSIACIPAVLTYPLGSLMIANDVGTIGAMVSLLLGVLGAYVGTWWGMGLGESFQRLEGAA